jgi:hypothetical protein
LQCRSQKNRDSTINVRRETSKTFRNKKEISEIKKVSELETNRKDKDIRELFRGINEFRKVYQPIT